MRTDYDDLTEELVERNLTDTEMRVESIARAAVQDAIDFIESDIAPIRLRAQKYHSGEVNFGHEKGRSSVVATKIRDTVRQIKPSLQRIFFSTNRPVEFSPTGAADVQVADVATEACNAEFRRNNGYRVFCDATHDAMVKKLGVVKVFWDDAEDTTLHRYANLGYGQLLILNQDPSVEIAYIEQTAPGLFDVDAYRTQNKGQLRFEPIPPEDFIIDRNASCADDAYVIGHRSDVRVADLIAMGVDYDTAIALPPIAGSAGTQSEEKSQRTGLYSDGGAEHIEDPTMRLVSVTEVYMRIDVDEDGHAAMHKILLGGNADFQLLSVEEWDTPRFALFSVDPEPHTVFGSSISEILFDEQDAATMMLRGLLDNVALVNSPREEVVDEFVNMDDFLNNEIGAFVRVTRPGSINQLVTPPVMNETLPVVQYLDREVENKTGVTRMSGGLHADGISKSMSATEASGLLSMQSGQLEVMARNVAEGGMAQLFKHMLQLLIENAPPEYFARLAETNYQPVDPRSWNVDMDVIVNVGVGTGNQDQKIAALQETLQQQLLIWQQGGGPQNGMVSLTMIRNTLADLLSARGIYNHDRYYAPMDEQREQTLLAQAAQAAQQQQGPDPATMALLQGEQIKAQSRERIELMKLAQKASEAQQADDRERDQMLQDLFVSAAEILGQYGTSVDVARIQRQQAVNGSASY